MTAPYSLLESIESGLFLLPTVTAQFEPFGIPGVKGRLTPVSDPLANILGDAKLDAHEVSATIDRVMGFFSHSARAFSWRVGPLSTPPELGRHLLKAGMKKADSLSGLVLSDLEVSLSIPPDVHISEARRGDLAKVIDLIAQGYPVPERLATILANVFLQPSVRGYPTTGVYLASAGAGLSPVAIGVSFYFPDRPTVVLGGAATLPEFRGGGIYRSLIAHRLREAKKRGVTSAVMQAVRSTSAPIANKVGFIEACEIEVYKWSPKH